MRDGHDGHRGDSPPAARRERVPGRSRELESVGLEFFVAGVSVPQGSDGSVVNNAFTWIYTRADGKAVGRRLGSPEARFRQSKHHRWKLDRGQIVRYHLGHALDPCAVWWEDIHLGERAVNFMEVRHGAALAVLVCEDLARIDPVQPAIRAIGPNLLVALLMDGAQLEKRWPGRYATVLADDPGSSVLTLNSLGMVLRSAPRGEAPSRAVALWKDASGDARALTLSDKAQALLLTLSVERVTEHTLDRRSDGGVTLQFSLSGVRDVFHPDPPRWALT